jgi:curved DNA-binding protein CbpA
MNYYVALGVARDASYEAIRQAFRALARQYHPDAGTGASVERFRAIVEAYETLSDPARRRAYDHSITSSRLRPTFPQRFDIRLTPDPLIPKWRRHAERDSLVMRDDVVEPLFAEDLFEMLDHLFFRPPRTGNR